jgi:2'-5' RNA ligase
MNVRRDADGVLAEAPEGDREPARRLFFALWPSEAMRDALVHATRKAVRSSGGRPVPGESLHLTLAFLGPVAERRVAELTPLAREVAAVASAETIDLLFDRLEHWRAAQLLCALPAAPPMSVGALAQRLKERLSAGGFALDLKPFRPHVTVARKVPRPPRTLAMHPLLWTFTGFALIESRTEPSGALYSVVESYPLAETENSAK